jgi:hypothetical protein
MRHIDHVYPSPNPNLRLSTVTRSASVAAEQTVLICYARFTPIAERSSGKPLQTLGYDMMGMVHDTKAGRQAG